MFLKSTTIENFKVIKNSTFEFDKKFNLIIGNNGVGKTSLLEAVGVGLGGFLTGVDGVYTVHFSPDDVRRVGTLVGEGSYDIEYSPITTVTCVADFNNKQINWERSKRGVKKTSRTVTEKTITKFASKLVQDKRNIFPIINYQSAARMWRQKNDTGAEPKDDSINSYLRIAGYIDCLADESTLKRLTHWCERMDYISWQKSIKIAEYEAVKKAVGKFMDVLQETATSSTIFYDKRTDDLIYSSDAEILPLRFMSAGYRSAIGMVADIAYRMAVLNPDLKLEATEKTNGIILIDEVDLHIHPKWQWRIVEALVQTFPEVQFIVTTHSPIVIASCKDKKIISLFDANNDSNTVELDNRVQNSAYGWLVDDVLNKYMGADERVSEVKSKLKEIEQLSIKKIKKSITDEEKFELKQLKSEVYSTLPENDAVVELMELDAIDDILRERGT